MNTLTENSTAVWFADFAYQNMMYFEPYYFGSMAALFLLAGLIGMTPLRYEKEHNFGTALLVKVRYLIIWSFFFWAVYPVVIFTIYDSSMQSEAGYQVSTFWVWFKGIAFRQAWWLPCAALIGMLIRYIYTRYCLSLISMFMRSLRFRQSKDELSDIKKEHSKYQQKNFDPQKYYAPSKGLFVGLDEKDKPIYIDHDTWLETNMQIIGPTRYGKGVLAGVLMDQTIERGNALFYIDPKKDRFAPEIMYQAALRNNTPFYYLDLSNDDDPGAYAPFTGGNERDALARLFNICGVELTGNPGTDFYKTQERRELTQQFKSSRTLQGILKSLNMEQATKSEAILSELAEFKTFAASKKNSFSIARALKQGAVVYVRGSLTDSSVKAVTRSFIMELVQETMALEQQRDNHVTIVIDEVRFLVSKQLADALSTIVGFRANIVTLYQSIKDLLAPDDITINGQALLQSINVNSQLKAIYGGADSETAEWIAELSGETVKRVTKFEKTTINEGAGEIWDKGRMIGEQQEALIHSNTVKSLPPRICALFQPSKPANLVYTSWIQLKVQLLADYLDSLRTKKKGNQKKESGKPAQKTQVEPVEI